GRRPAAPGARGHPPALQPHDGGVARGRRAHGALGTTHRSRAPAACARGRPTPAGVAARRSLTVASPRARDLCLGAMAAPRGLSPDCLIETAEGPVRMADTPGQGFAVMTRLPPAQQLGFRQLIKVETAESVPLVRVVLETGHAAVTAHGHRFYRRGMEAVAAE